MTLSYRMCRASVVWAALILCGCAATNVQTEYEHTGRLPAPAMIVVYRFAISADEITENQGFVAKAERDFGSTPMDEVKRQTAHEAAARMANDLVSGIRSLGLTADLASNLGAIPPNAVLVRGVFIDVDEGNRARRLAIGFGAGQAKVDTRFELVASGSNQPIGKFETHTDSGEMPGALVTMGAGAAAQGGATVGMAAANVGVSGVKGYESAVDPMIDRSADKAVVTLSQFFGSQGWIPPNMVKTSTWPSL